MTSSREVLSRLGNYLSQLRAYSYVDLLLLWFALGASGREIAAASLLWFGFLIHLEWRHGDTGRERWDWRIWVALWIVGAALSLSVASLLVIALATAYSLKKRIPLIGRLSFIYNGGIKVALCLIVPGLSPRWVLLILALMSFRNLMGDFRDIEKDTREGVKTLPVALGLRKDVKWLYPATLALTSLVWTLVGDVDWRLLVVAWMVQAATYRLTPR